MTDFDGTVTRRDFYDLVRERWPQADDPWAKYLAGTCTHFAALAEIFSRIRATESEMDAVVDAMDIDPGFAPAVRTLQARGWEVVIASAGCAWYIDRLLAHAGVAVTVFSNPGTFDPAMGLRMERPDAGPFCDPATGVDKVAVTRDALQRSSVVAFAGDGRPDLAPALLVPGTRRFARGWLADALRTQNEEFHPLTVWASLPAMLP